MEEKNIIADATTDLLHHVGLINFSPDESSAQYEKPGFTLTPLSLPKIALSAGGLAESVGAGNGII